MKGAEFAILMSKHGSSDCAANVNAAEEQNHKDLRNELSLLQYGEYFANSFAKRAHIYSVEIPSN